jgi:hypothetical protein
MLRKPELPLRLKNLQMTSFSRLQSVMLVRGASRNKRFHGRSYSFDSVMVNHKGLALLR